MVWAKSSTIRQTNWDIGDDGQRTICQRRPERQIMRYFVDRQEKILICGSANNVGGEKE